MWWYVPQALVGHDLAEDFVETNGDFPVGVMRLKLGQI